jgi:hypothetical protein
MLLSLIAAFVAAAPASPTQRSECEEYVAKVLASADAETRVVITFTGSQRALLPLDETAGVLFDSTLFPVARNLFVSTLQVRVSQPDPAMAAAFARQTCSVGLSKGAHFNGVMAFKREAVTIGGRRLMRDRMISGMMAKMPDE